MDGLGRVRIRDSGEADSGRTKTSGGLVSLGSRVRSCAALLSSGCDSDLELAGFLERVLGGIIMLCDGTWR